MGPRLNKYLILCLLILFSLQSRSQAVLSNELIAEKLEAYSKANPNDILFVHTDKTLYTNNETIWFSAYLMAADKSQLKEHSFLSVSIAREDTREIIIQEQYLMGKGLSFGSIALPDSVPPGNYRFRAFTNVLDKSNKPAALFEQALTIKSITQPDFTFTIDLLDSVPENGSLRALVNISLKDPKDKTRPVLEYSIGKNKSQAITLRDKTHVINISSKELSQHQPTLLAAVSLKGKNQYLTLKLPEIKDRGISVRFFPEGGHLSAGLKSVVGWETKTSSGRPLGLEGVIFRNDQATDTIRTNSIGIGKFELKPDDESVYTLRIKAGNFLPADTIIQFPRILKSGLVIKLADAIVKDSLQFTLFSQLPRYVSVLIHNYRFGYRSFKVLARPSGAGIKADLSALPKGIYTLTVLDESGKPLAERLFFTHYNSRVQSVIQPDKNSYSRKEGASVRLRLTDGRGMPVKAILSIAVVQDSRLERTKFRDIETSYYLEHALGEFEKDPFGRGFENKDFLEDLLLVKGWRSYTWQSLINSTARDSLELHKQAITAQLKLNGKPMRKPQSINLLRDSLLETITTSADGSVVLTPEQLAVTEGRKIIATVNQDSKTGYSLDVDNPLIRVHEELAGQSEIRYNGPPITSQNSNDQQIKGLERMIALQEVVVQANKTDDSLYGMTSNACGDFVCQYGILNCPNHFGAAENSAPVAGKSYKIPGGGGMSTYFKCNADDQQVPFLKLKGIYLSREFYGVPGDPVSLQEPQFLSTLFWRPGVVTDEKGEAEFSFITGDITGLFRIVVEGLSNSDVLFGETSFMVK